MWLLTQSPAYVGWAINYVLLPAIFATNTWSALGYTSWCDVADSLTQALPELPIHFTGKILNILSMKNKKLILWLPTELVRGMSPQLTMY